MIDLTKKYKTKDGRNVELIGFTKDTHYPLVGSIQSNDGTWVNSTWTKDGKLCYSQGETLSDLVEIPNNITIDLHRGDFATVFRGGSVGFNVDGMYKAITSDQMNQIIEAHNQLTQ